MTTIYNSLHGFYQVRMLHGGDVLTLASIVRLVV